MSKRKTKRDQLLEAGIEVFAEKGFEKSTIDDIVLKTGCGKGTFYRYFSNKDDLFQALDEKFLNEMNRALKANLKDSLEPREYLLNCIETFLQVFTRNNQIGLVRFERDFRLAADQRFESSQKILANFLFMKEYFHKAIKKGKLRKVNPEAILVALIGSAHFFLFRDFKLGIPYTQDEIADTIEIIFSGVKPL